MKGRVILLLIVSLLASASTLADKRAPVEELPVGNPEDSRQAGEMNSQQVEVYYQMQVLQEEVRQLRGLLEEMSHELKQLKQRQMDDYLDLDRRVSSLSSMPATNPGGSVANTPGQVNSNVYSGSDSAATGVSVGTEKDHYSAAYLLLRDKQIDQAADAFRQHVQRYPNGNYVANAWYWLGEIYVLKGQLDDARQAFAAVVDNFPTHRKAPDAALGLGKVYHQLGDNAQAKDLLQKVATGNSAAANKARQYLADNF